MTPLEVRPLDGVGAEISGVDLSAINVGDWNQIEAAFAAFGLLIFRDQILTETDHQNFAERWGPVESATGLAEGHQHSVHGKWHSDQSFRKHPPRGAIEIARHIPGDGASVRFASTIAAFDALSTSTQRALEALSARHSSGPSDDEATSIHPVVIHHPVSGHKTLYVNPTFTTSVDEMEEREGLALLNQLYEHGQRPEFTTTVEWELGMVIVWDSRAVWQFVAYGRELPTIHRVTMSGEALRSAIGPEKKTPTLTERAGATLAGGILTAAMTGIAEVIDPERVKHDIEIVSEAPEREPLSDLDFGDLPPLD